MVTLKKFANGVFVGGGGAVGRGVSVGGGGGSVSVGGGVSVAIYCPGGGLAMTLALVALGSPAVTVLVILATS